MKTKRIIRKIKKRIFLKVSDGIKIKKIDELAITPTMKCCLNCVMCHQKEIKHWENMPFEDFRKFLINLKKSGVTKISLVGGEIFVHPDMWKFIDLMEKMKFQYDLSSNLFFIPGGVEKFKKLKGLEMITTSIDGLGEQHCKIRGVPNSFENTVENIKKIVSMKIPIDVACVIQKENVSNLEKIIEFICSIGVKSFTLILENNLTKNDQEFNKKIIKKLTNKESEILVSSIKNSLGTMSSEDWSLVLRKLRLLSGIAIKNGCSLNIPPQLFNPSLLKEKTLLNNYTCGIFKGYNMIAYNDANLPFCGFIKLKGNYSLLNRKPLDVANSLEYIELRDAFYKHGALPMCRMCCALKKK